MKRIIIALFALTFMLTTAVACSDDEGQNTDNSSVGTVGGTQSNTSSAEELTSEELDAWGNVSIEIEAGYGDAVSTDTATSSVESATSESGTASSTSPSEDKDQGFGPWVSFD